MTTAKSLEKVKKYNDDFASTTTTTPLSTEKKKRLDIAVVGLPNAGKSQLLNVLTASTVSAVSRKRHTTRQGIMGARTVKDTQLVFVDTPGFLRVEQAKKEGLQRNLVVTAASEIAQVDFSLLVVDAARTLTDGYKQTLVTLMLYAMQSQGRDEIIDEDEDEESDYEDLDEDMDDDVDEEEGISMDEIRPKFAIVLNKVDLVKPKSLLLETAMEIGMLAEESIQYAGQKDPTQESTVPLDPKLLDKLMPPFFYTSALRDEGVDDLLQFLFNQATPSQEWPLEPHQSTSLSPQERVEEIIREKIYRCLHKEVPYSIRQNNKLLRVTPDGKSVIIQQEILVQTKSHKELVYGTSGKTLERVRETAAFDLEKLFKCPVQLIINVKHVQSKNRDWSI